MLGTMQLTIMLVILLNIKEQSIKLPIITTVSIQDLTLGLGQLLDNVFQMNHLLVMELKLGEKLDYSKSEKELSTTETST